MGGRPQKISSAKPTDAKIERKERKKTKTVFIIAVLYQI